MPDLPKERLGKSASRSVLMPVVCGAVFLILKPIIKSDLDRFAKKKN